MLAAVLLGVFLAAGCSSHASDQSAEVDPELRAVHLETVGCGFASDHFGSGVVIGDGLVITVAHVVVRAKSIGASVAGSPAQEAVVAAVDLRRDLALLRLELEEMPGLEMTTVDAGTRGLIVGGAASGTVPFEVKRRVNLRIEEILDTERHSRLGYELDARTSDGDSGAGAYDERGQLVGIVFASGEDEDTSWLTASSEIEDFLATVGPQDSYPLCQ